MIDHPAQLDAIVSASVPFPHPPGVFLKIDTSYGRAGVAPGTPACSDLISAALDTEARGLCRLHGLYSHAGHSYGARHGPADVLTYLATEFRGLASVVADNATIRGRYREGEEKLVLSVGATPTATVVQQLGLLTGSEGAAGGGGGVEDKMGEVEQLVADLKGQGYALEVHAGV